jgi:tetratricopeptide (TPR) repeat protein
MEESAFKEDGGILYSIRKDWNTAIPAGSVEAGMSWWFSGNAGLGIKAGYRLASGKVMIKITNISGWSGESQGMSNVDYSGVYANAGLVFKFDDADNKTKKKETPAMDGQFPEISAKLYNEAAESYDEGLLHGASEKIDQAAGIAPGDVKINELKAKIDTALKSEKSAASVDKLLKQAEQFRDKNQIKKSRARYLEVLAMEKNNTKAEFYIKEYNRKSEEFLKLAGALKSAGDNEKSYKNAKQAAEYNPDNEEAANLVNELKNIVASEKDITKKYNKAVEEYKHNRYQEAIELWDEVILANPDDKQSVDNREKAIKKIEESDTEKKTNVARAVKQAQNLYDIGKIKEAEKKCEFVLRLDPENEQCKKLYEAITKLNEDSKTEVMTKR